MNFSCPISGKKVDETIARLNALATLAAYTFFALTRNPWIPIFMSIDFLIRGFIDPKISPLSLLNRFISSLLRLPVKAIDRAPKVFAAKIGFFLSVLISALSIAGLRGSALPFAALIWICAALEAFFAFCVGCKIWSLAQAVKRRTTA
jgi:hypothetical protein